MNATEAVKLTRIVKALCPQQTIDTFTPDAWHDVLRSYDFDACKEAASTVASRQPFVSPSEIIAVVKAARRDRLNGADESFVFTGDPDDAREYQRQLFHHRRMVAEGLPLTEHPQLEQRYSSPDQVMSRVFKSPTKTLIPAQRVTPSPQTQARIRAREERAAQAALEGELLPAERAS